MSSKGINKFCNTKSIFFTIGNCHFQHIISFISFSNGLIKIKIRFQKLRINLERIILLQRLGLKVSGFQWTKDGCRVTKILARYLLHKVILLLTYQVFFLLILCRAMGCFKDNLLKQLIGMEIISNLDVTVTTWMLLLFNQIMNLLSNQRWKRSFLSPE